MSGPLGTLAPGPNPGGPRPEFGPVSGLSSARARACPELAPSGRELSLDPKFGELGPGFKLARAWPEVR